MCTPIKIYSCHFNYYFFKKFINKLLSVFRVKYINIFSFPKIGSRLLKIHKNIYSFVKSNYILHSLLTDFLNMICEKKCEDYVLRLCACSSKKAVVIKTLFLKINANKLYCSSSVLNTLTFSAVRKINTFC